MNTMSWFKNALVDKVVTNAVKKTDFAITYLQNEREVMKVNIEKLLIELQTVRLELSTCQQNFEETLSEVNSLAEDKARLEQRNSELASENEQLKAKNSAQLEANSTLIDDYRDAQFEIAKLREQNGFLTVDLDSLELETKRWRTESEKQIKSASSECARHLADVEVLKAKNKILKTKTVKVQKEIEKLYEELASQRFVEQDLRKRLAEEKEASGTIKRELDSSRALANNQKDATKETIAELQRTRKLVHDLEDSKRQLLKRLSNIQANRRRPRLQSLHYS